MKNALLLCVLVSCSAPPSGSASKRQEICGTPATAATRIIYEGLKAECAGCHQSGTRGYFSSLGAFQALLVSDPRLVAPGNPDGSELLKLLEARGTGAFKQMPIAGQPYALRTAGAGASIADIRAWITALTAQARDNRPAPLARPITRISAQQAQRALYQQLGLVHDDFFIVASEYSLPMAETRGDGRYPVLSQDSLPAPRQGEASGRFEGLGGGAVVGQVKPDSSITPTFVLTLQQVSQAWCRLALAKPGNVALFPAGMAVSSDPASAKTTIQRWSTHFLAQSMPASEVEALHAEVFAPLLVETNQTSAYVGLCSYFIRHPLWNFY